MGTWGTALFSSDLACDIRDHYRSLLEDGIEDKEATRHTLEKFKPSFDDPEEGAVSIIALAVTQSSIGRLEPDIRRKALAALKAGADLSIWEEENPKLLEKRRQVLDRARAQLTGPQPAPKRLRKPRRAGCGLSAGDILSLSLPKGIALLRVFHVSAHRLGETPYVELLRTVNTKVPSEDKLISLKAVRQFTAFTAYDKINWEQAGFKKVAHVTLPNREKPRSPDEGISWSALAEKLLKKAAGRKR